MKRLLAVLLAVCALLTLCTAASAASVYDYSAQEKKDIERTLTMFHWYALERGGSYSALTALNTTQNNPLGLMRALTSNPLCVDYSMYPVAQPQRITGYDPLRRWGNTMYYKISEDSVEWVLKYVLRLTDAQIDTLIARVDSGVNTNIYRYQGCYYTWFGGVGDGFVTSIIRIVRDGDRFRVTYHLGDIYGEDMGTRYAVFTRTTYEGRQYWSLLYMGKTEPASGMPFLDVMASDYYAEPIAWAYEESVTSGTSDLSFSPESTCTRGQIVTFLWRAMGQPEPKQTTNPFTDVKTSDYYYKPVLWAVEQGVTLGTSGTTFSPDAPCTRAHVVTFLWRAEGQPDAGGANPFADVPAGQYYTSAVLWAVSRNITKGTDATHFSPDSPCTRGQIVTFLYRDMA